MPQSGESTQNDRLTLFKPVSSPSFQRPRHPAPALSFSHLQAPLEVLRPQPLRGPTTVPRPYNRRSLQTAKLTPIPRRGRLPQQQASVRLLESKAFRMRIGAHRPLPPRRRQPPGPIPAPPPRGNQSARCAPLPALAWKVGRKHAPARRGRRCGNSWCRVAAAEAEAVAAVAGG